MFLRINICRLELKERFHFFESFLYPIFIPVGLNKFHGAESILHRLCSFTDVRNQHPNTICQHCFFERFCPFVCVVFATIRADATVASEIDGLELATSITLICEVTATFILAGQHLVDFFDLNIAKVIYLSEAKRIPVVIILEDVFHSEGWIGWETCGVQQLDEC